MSHLCLQSVVLPHPAWQMQRRRYSMVQCGAVWCRVVKGQHSTLRFANKLAQTDRAELPSQEGTDGVRRPARSVRKNIDSQCGTLKCTVFFTGHVSMVQVAPCAIMFRQLNCPLLTITSSAWSAASGLGSSGDVIIVNVIIVV